MTLHGVGHGGEAGMTDPLGMLREARQGIAHRLVRGGRQGRAGRLHRQRGTAGDDLGQIPPTAVTGEIEIHGQVEAADLFQGRFQRRVLVEVAPRLPDLALQLPQLLAAEVAAVLAQQGLQLREALHALAAGGLVERQIEGDAMGLGGVEPRHQFGEAAAGPGPGAEAGDGIVVDGDDHIVLHRGGVARGDGHAQVIGRIAYRRQPAGRQGIDEGEEDGEDGGNGGVLAYGACHRRRDPAWGLAGASARAQPV